MVRFHFYKHPGFLWLLLWNIILCCKVHAQEGIPLKQEMLWIKKIDALFQQKHYSTAAHHIESILSQSSPNISGQKKESLEFKQMQIGIIRKEAYFVALATACYNATGNLSNKTQIAYLLSNHYFELGMYRESLVYLEAIDKSYLNNYQLERVQFQKAVSYFSEKKFDNAKPYFKNIIEIEKSIYKSASSYYLGFIAFSEKKFSEALTFFLPIEKDSIYSRAIPFYLAYIYYDQANKSKTLRYGEEYLKNPQGLHHFEMKQLLASVYFNQNEFSKASSLYEKLLEEGLELNPTQRFELGTCYHLLGKQTEAIEQLRPLSIGKDDVSTDAMFVLGLSYLEEKDKSNARNAFKYCTASGLSQDKKEIAIYLDAKLSFELGFEDQGIKGMTSFLDDYPNSIFNQEAKEILIQYYSKTNNFKSAFEMIDKVDLSNPVIKSVLPKIYYGRGVELIYDLQYDQAEQLLKLLNTFPQSNFRYLSVFWRGEIEFRKNNFQAALKYFQEYLSAPGHVSGDANPLNALYNLGYCFYELEDYKNAYSNFEQVLSMNKDASDSKIRDAILRAADCSFMNKDFSNAKSLYTKVMQWEGFGSDYATFQVALIEGVNSPEIKIAMLKDAVKKYKDSPFSDLINMELADTYLSEENFEAAIPVLNELISNMDKDDELMPASILKLGIANYNLDNNQEAVKQYNLLIKDYPSSPQTSEALENAKLMFLEDGKIDEYQHFLESAGKSIGSVEKDSLTYRYIQNAYAIDPSPTILNTLDSYINQFPNGIYITHVLALKADLHLKTKSYLAAAETFEEIASKGPGPLQEKSIKNAARLYSNDLNDYNSSIRCYKKLIEVSNNPSMVTEGYRGLVRSLHFLENFQEPIDIYEKLLMAESASLEDSALAFLMIGYAAQSNNDFEKSNEYFQKSDSLSSIALDAEAKYQIAKNYFLEKAYAEAEKQAINTIENGGSNEKWITKAYILLADIFVDQKDYFNAKATLKSVIEHCKITALKEEASAKLKIAETEEKSTHKKSEKK